MKRKNANGKASSSSKRSKGRGDEEKEVQIDRISNLPDSVIAHILSFLPTQDAVKTLLLRRFGLLWATSDNLHLDARSFHGTRYNKRFINFVHHVLTLHQRNPINRFHLKFEFYLLYSIDEWYLKDPGSQQLVNEELKLTNEINNWTHFAIRREVKVLDLDFFAGGDSDEPEMLYKIPDFVFSCDSIRELKLVHCKVEPQGQILMRSLRTLFLKSVALNGHKIDEILSGFPLLENLSLIECYNLCKLNFVSPNLKYLKVVVRRSQVSRLEISGPNIISLDISGSVGLVDLKNLCSLKDAALGFTNPFRWDENHEARKILEYLNHAKVLTIYEESVLLWTQWELVKISCPSMLEKYIILNTDLTKDYLPGIASMLRSSPCLEMLDIHIGKTYHAYSWFERELDVENYFVKLEESSQVLTNNLRTVRIYGLVAEPCVLQLVQFLLKNSMGLETMMITSKRSDCSNQKSYFTSVELLELSKKLLSFPRASSSAVILFS